jgi:hypothetical protein
MIAMVPQFLCFGGGGGGGAPPAVPLAMLAMPVAAGFGIENVAVFILSVKAAADLRQSSGGTHCAQVYAFVRAQKENNRVRMEESCILKSESMAFVDALEDLGNTKR